MRHSCEHVLTQAMLRLYPGLLMAMGPAIVDGFYFDFDPSTSSGQVHKISEADFPQIEAEMAKIINQDLPIRRQVLSVKEARKLFPANPYKKEWLDEIAKRQEKATVYWTGGPSTSSGFVDLCRGPHLKSTGEIGAFKLLSIAGAYWHGDEKNKMLARIYGTCFPTQEELDEYLRLQAEAKKRDHRKLGQELELFMFDDEVGQGLALWLPKGAFIRHKIMEFAFNTYLERGYQPVSTPHLASEALWQHSGHLEFYQESMYRSFGIDQEKYRLKPMNCPLQVKIYNFRPRSYKELPLRWTEMGTVYRYEKAGVLHGLTRVRGFTQDDAHIICRPDQLHAELVAALKLTFFILNAFGFKDFEMILSVRDPKNKQKYAGSSQGWKMAEKALSKALAAVGCKDYVLDVGGAVFYGPKIDLKVADSLGRKWQLSTIQFDFNLPGRFKMKYVGPDGKTHEPFMIHRALLGSLERFLGVYLEHTGGAFPVWLAPIQAVVMPITDQQQKYGEKIQAKLTTAKIRVDLDSRPETVQAKIRDAELQKIPYMLILGPREVKNQTISVRQRGSSDSVALKLEQLLVKINKEVEKKQ